MIVKAFPYNPVIDYIEYNQTSLEMNIVFKKTEEIRTYAEVPKDAFWGMYYLNNTKQLLSYYTKNLRKKFKLITIKPLKKNNDGLFKRMETR